MGKVTALLYERFKAGKLPLTVQSMDNCSHNGDKVKSAVHAYASKWVEQGLVPAEFLAYVQDTGINDHGHCLDITDLLDEGTQILVGHLGAVINRRLPTPMSGCGTQNQSANGNFSATSGTLVSIVENIASVGAPAIIVS